MITVERVEEIREKIATLKERKAKAEGAMEKIEEGWEKQYGFTTIEEAEEKLEELKTEINNGEGRLQKLSDEIEAAADWDDIE